jgi:hypothetical protein
MHRFVPVSAATVLLVGCSQATVGWQPSLVSQVPDSTPVKFAPASEQRALSGRALDWQRGTPKVITSRGDTLVVPREAAVSVRLPDRVRHPGTGAVIGAVVGIFGSLGVCSDNRCEEGNPYQLVGALAGALIGYSIKTDHWVRVRWDPLARD